MIDAPTMRGFRRYFNATPIAPKQSASVPIHRTESDDRALAALREQNERLIAAARETNALLDRIYSATRQAPRDMADALSSQARA